MQVYKFYKNNFPGCYSLSRTLSTIELKNIEIIEKNVENEDDKKLAKSFGLNIVPALVKVKSGKSIIGGKLKRDEILEFLKEE